MSTPHYIQVLLPLKLDWEPVYALPEGSEASIGDKIEVNFAGKNYPGIVTAVDVVPEPGIDIKIAGTEASNDGCGTSFSGPTTTSFSGLSRESLKQLEFWRQLASYYLCTPGEVYKTALIQEKPIKRQPKKTEKQGVPVQLSLEQEAAYSLIIDAFSKHKTVLLDAPAGSGKTELYLRLAADTMSRGKSVLYLVPDISLTKQLEDKIGTVFPEVLAYNSSRTQLARHRIALEVSSGGRIVLGTKQALFLPFQDLGLIIVDQEHDASFKQESPAPRYNTRETAIMLAGVHGANVILGSETPSLESLYNAQTGLFTKVQLKENLNTESATGINIINTSAEMRKDGMSGEFSLKLLEEIKAALNANLPVLVLRTQRYSPLIEDELSKFFPDAKIQVCGRKDIRTVDLSGPGLCVIMHADIFLTQPNFRSDERALQLLRLLQGPDGNRRLVIQTHTPKHPVFQALKNNSDSLVFLEERKQFNLPPFTRVVDILVEDKKEDRLKKVIPDLIRVFEQVTGLSIAPSFSGLSRESLIRITIPRDKSLKSRKEAIFKAVEQFEKDHKYTGHIVIDVDPV